MKTSHPSTPEDCLVSVVIPTHNRAQLVREAVEDLWRQTLPPQQWEIIIADNCSTDDTPAVVAALQTRSPCRVRHHRLTRDGGPSMSRNAGARLATGRYIALTDGHVHLDPAWLERAVAHADADPTVGILAGKLVYASQPEYVNAYGGAFSRIGLAWDANERRPAAAITESAEFLWVATAAVLIRRDVFERLGGFDEIFFYAFEDSDLGWRVNLAGYRCRCVPELLAHHRVGDWPQASCGPLIIFHSRKNRLRSLIKNYGWRRLSIYLPVHLAYAFVDLVLRPPRWPKIRALWWNLIQLPTTLRLRREVQRMRVRRDRDLDHLFAPRWFPAEPVAVRHRLHAELHAGDHLETLDTPH